MRNTAGSTGISDYIVARQFSLDRKWMTGLGDEYAVTSEGRRVYNLVRTGKYKIIGATLAAEREKTSQHCPIVYSKAETTGVVGHQISCSFDWSLSVFCFG